MHTTNISDSITRAMYEKCVHQGPVVGRILAFAVCPLEGMCDLIAKPIVAIEMLVRSIFTLPFDPKLALKQLNASAEQLLSTIPETITLVPRCFYQFFAAMYDPQQVQPFHTDTTFKKAELE